MKQFGRNGYALLIALHVAAILMLVALTACAVLFVESHQTVSAVTLARARFNAIASARIALGELQRTLGPDQRVTANAVLLERDHGAPASPHWCGVWRTDRLRGEPGDAPPFIHRNSTGALVDDRQSRDSKRTFDSRAHCLGWLVSGNESDPMRPIAHGSRIVRTALAKRAEVRAPYEHDGLGGDICWWVSDENQKAAIRPCPQSPVADGAKTAKATTPCAVLPGWLPEGTPPARTPLSRATLTVERLIGEADLAGLDDDVTTEARRIPVDVMRGGLCHDLTPYLTGQDTADAPDDSAPLLSESAGDETFARHGPRFGLLRNWANLRRDGLLTPSAGSRHFSTSDKPSTLFHSGTHPDLPDVAAGITPVVAPVITEAAVYRRVSYDPSKRNQAGAPWMRLHLHPRIVLWNPYSDKLAGARYLVHLRINGSPEFRLVNANRPLTGAITGWRVYTPSLVNYAITQGTLLFVIDCPTLNPGQSMLFLPPTTAPLYAKSAAAAAYAPLANTLVPSPALTLANYYLEDTDAFEDKSLNALAGMSLVNERWRMENAAAEDYAVALNLLPATVPPTWQAVRTTPTLRYLSASIKCGYGTTSVAGWPAGRTSPLDIAMDAPPPLNSRDGIRLRRLHETFGNKIACAPASHMDTAILADNNPTAVFQFLHPLANHGAAPSAQDRRVDKFGLFTRDEFDSTVDWAAFATTDIAAHPLGTPAEFRGCPATIVTGAPTASESIRSLAEFSFAPFSPYTWHPLRSIGESRITPASPPESTAAPGAIQSFDQLQPLIRDGVRTDDAPESLRVFDLRFELNHAIWDKYVCLGGTADQRRAFVTGSVSSLNHNPDVIIGDETRLSHLTGQNACRHATAALSIDGAFNINSTSVTAWKHLLASDRGADANNAEHTAYPRFMDNPGTGCLESPKPTSPQYGHGHRRLTDREIESLATAIVEEVKRRGPFLSLSDFVNRRLSDEAVEVAPEAPSQNACGALQAAIDRAGINQLTRNPEGVIARSAAIPGSSFLERHQAYSRYEGGGGLLSQADLLTSFGHRITARGDCFSIQVVGTVDDGRSQVSVSARMLVRRTSEPLCADKENPFEPDALLRGRFGRRFTVTAWQWADRGDVLVR